MRRIWEMRPARRLCMHSCALLQYAALINLQGQGGRLPRARRGGGSWGNAAAQIVASIVAWRSLPSSAFWHDACMQMI